MSEKKYTIGVDVGGSHITCVAIDMQQKKMLKESLKREALSHDDTAENLFKIWAKAINECVEFVGKENVHGVGFAIPGPFEYFQGISMMQHKYPNLYKLHIPTELNKFLCKEFPMRFLNDASAFAVGVSWIGKGSGHEKVAVITLGTGFGSAYIHNGIPVIEGDDVAPEGCFWHLPYKNGIADEYFSTRWFVNVFQQKTGKQVKGVKDILNTPQAEEIFTEFANNLGEFLAPWLKKFKADVLVMGGNISLAFAYFGEKFLKKLQSEGCFTKVEVSELMEDAALVGAGRLFEEEFWNRLT